MLNNQPFYFSLIKKYVVLFGSIFSNLSFEKQIGTDTTTKKIILVPIHYSNKNKLLTRVDEDPTLNKDVAIALPRMAFELRGFEYDGTRKQPTRNYITFPDPATPTDKPTNKQYVPVPYNFHFNLYIAVSEVEDGSKIIEQILPFFTPDWTESVILIENTNAIHDIPIIFNGQVAYEDSFGGSFDVRREIVYTLSFTLKGFMYGPYKQPKIIKFVSTNFHIPLVEDDELDTVPLTHHIAEQLDVQVAMTANGQPTSNYAASVDYRTISIDENFGYATHIHVNDFANSSANTSD